MKNLNRCVSVFALSIYFMTGVQQAEATKRISLSQDEERPSKVSKNALQDILKELKDNKYISPVLIKNVKDLPMAELITYEATMTVDHELFDNWIRLILRAFPNTPDFRISLEKAKIKAGSEQTTPEAQSNLGYMYKHGQGVAQDLTKAVEWYTKSAEQGNDMAQYNLGYMYYFGKEVSPDLTKAFNLITQVFYQTHGPATLNLEHNQYGQGFPQDLTKAFDLIKGIVYQGPSTLNLEHNQYGQNFFQDLPKAFEWFTKSAEQGNAAAQYNLGHMYHSAPDISIPRDWGKAFEWYTKSAEQGYPPAQVKLGTMYRHGQHVSTDSIEALKWYFKSNEDQRFATPSHNDIKRETTCLVTLIPAIITLDQEETYKQNLATLTQNLEQGRRLHILQQDRTDSNSSFKEFKIPSLSKAYEQIITYENDLLETLVAYNNPGFMTTCLQPIHRTSFTVNRCSEIKYYYDTQGQFFLTFGKDNIERADKMMKMLSISANVYSSFNQAIDEILAPQRKIKNDYQTESLKIQKEFYNKLIPEDHVSHHMEGMKHRNEVIEEVNQEIESLTKLRGVSQELQKLLTEGTPYRNKMFLQKNPHIASIFED